MHSLNKINILIVDDSRAICEAIKAIFVHLGVKNIDLEHDGEAAIEQVKSSANSYDLIILDLQMQIGRASCRERVYAPV